MAVVRNLMVRAGADFSAMRKSMQKAQQDLNKFKNGVSKTMRGIGTILAATGVTLGIRAATRDAMQFEAALQQIGRLMGNNAASFQRWANEQASAFGMARSEAVRYGAVYANLISGFSNGTRETAQRTQELLQASAVIASSTGRTIEDTMERIRSGLLGSTEAIEDLGININVAMIESTQAFRDFAGDRSWQQLDFNTQQTIRYFAILEQAANKYGLELAQNTSSKQAAFVAQLKDAQLALGQAFLPIYNVILPALTRMAASLAEAARFVRDFTQALFGYTEQTKAVQEQEKAVDKLGDAYEEAGKKAKGSVAGFDEVNLLGQGSAAGGAGGGSIIPTDTTAQTGALTQITNAMSDVSTKAQEMAVRVKESFNTMRENIESNKEPIIAALAGIGAGISGFWLAANGGAMASTVKMTLANVAAILGRIHPIALVVSAAVAAVTAAFVYFYRTNEQFRGVVDGILQQIGNVTTNLWQNVMIPFGKWLATEMPKAWDKVRQAAQWFWKNVLVPLGDFLLWFWNSTIKPVSQAVGGVLAEAFKVVADIAKSFWKLVLVPLGNYFKETFGPAVEAVSAVFETLWKKVLKPLGNFLGPHVKIAWGAFVDMIIFLLDKALKPLVKFVGGALKTTFTSVFETMGEVIDGAKTAFIGLMNFITGVFTGDWDRAWNGVKDIFKGVFDGLYAIVKRPMNLIIDGINKMIGGINSISIDVPKWVGKIPGVPEGIDSFGFNIPLIPRLAKGGLAFGPTLAVVGDNPNSSIDPEVIAPLSKLQNMMPDNKEVVSVLKSILQAIKDSSGSDSVTMSKTALGRAATSAINDLQRRAGKTIITT